MILPDEVDVDGRYDSAGVRFLGKARRQKDGSWICLADVHGALCRVEVKITFDMPAEASPAPAYRESEVGA